MRNSIVLLTAFFFGIVQFGFTQNWYKQTYSIELDDVKSTKEIDNLSFYVVKGSRTNQHEISLDTNSLTIQFSFMTMGGEDATLIIEKNDKRMIVLYGNYYPDVGRANSQLRTEGKFRSGYFTSFDGHFLEIEEKDKDWWLITHQHHTPILTPIKTRVQEEFEQYLNFVLNRPNDSIAEFDSLINYEARYYTSQPLVFEIPTLSFADSTDLICIVNPKQITDSVLRLGFLDMDTSYVSETKLKQTLAVLSSELSYSETGSQLICRSYRKLSPLGE
ncbi:MAG: hypothetical protein ACI837_001067, partial [Crocinitomicaceae bacterium]